MECGFFQNQQVWTRALPAERASWCLTDAAFNDCLSSKSSSSDNLCTILPVWLEHQVETLPFAACDRWQAVIMSLDFQKKQKKQKLFFTASITMCALVLVLVQPVQSCPVISCTSKCCDAFTLFCHLVLYIIKSRVGGKK